MSDTPICETCGMPKKPIGRDAAPAMANGLCDYECPGYLADPIPGTLWPGEAPAPSTPATQAPPQTPEPEVYQVLAIEWPKKWPDGTPATGPMTVITVHGHVGNVGVGDTIHYQRLPGALERERLLRAAQEGDK